MPNTKRPLVDLLELFKSGLSKNVSVQDIKDFLISVFADIDYGGANHLTAENIKDAFDKKHIHDNKTILDAIQEVFTTALKNAYDQVVTDSHTHSNQSIIDSTEESFTTALKAAYDFEAEITKVVYVDGNRTDLYMVIGSIAKPHKEIQDAIDASSENTLIKIAPGTYTENIVMKAGIILEGIRGLVTITSSSGDTILIDSISSVTLKDLSITNTDPTMKVAVKFVNAPGSFNKIYNCSISSLGRSLEAVDTTGIHCFTTYFYGTMYLDEISSASFTNHGWLYETSGLEILLQIKNSDNIIFSNSFTILANNSKAVKIEGSTLNIGLDKALISSTNEDAIELVASTIMLTASAIQSGTGKKDLILDATSKITMHNLLYDLTKVTLPNPLNVTNMNMAWQQLYLPIGTTLTSCEVQSALTEICTKLKAAGVAGF